MKNQAELTFKLDIKLGAIGANLSTLNDVKDKLGYLREDMDTAVYRGLEQAYFQEFHRTVRILDDLIRYSMEELNTNFDETNEISHLLFYNNHNLCNT